MTLLEFVRISRAGFWTLVLGSLLGCAVAYAWHTRLPEVYQADASGYVSVGGDRVTPADEVTATSVGGSRASAYLPLVTSRAVAQQVIASTGLAMSPQEVAGRITAWVEPSSVILKISATGPTARDAQVLADAAIAATAKEANRLETESAGSASSLVRIIPIEQALPGARVAPNLRRNLAMGLAAGLVGGYLLVFLRRQLDTKLRSVGDAEAATSLPVLGVIPETRELGESRRRGRGPLTEVGAAAEPIRQLRTNLRFVDVDRAPRSIVVTSANASEGKSTVSATLARALAAAGRRTVIIDADMRRPSLGRLFDQDDGVGLSQLLSGDVQLAEVLRPTDEPNLQVIPAGRIPPNPSELLGSHRMQALVESLAEDSLVILDAPPLLPVTDAGQLAGSADCALFVFAVGSTRKEQAELAARLLSHAGGRAVGVVLNRAPVRSLGDVRYGYGAGAYTADAYTHDRYEPRRAKRSRTLRLGRKGALGRA